MEMSLKDSMATPEMQTQHPAALTTNAGGSALNVSNFVKAIDRKARSYFKMLGRSFSSSTTERGEDPSSMTIEFLRAHLQAQRADYKAEKQRAQRLAKKVLELEHKLSFEIERRKKAEFKDMLIFPRHRSGSLGPNKDFPHCNEELSREGLTTITRSQLKDNSSYMTGDEDHPLDWCSEISENEGHMDGDLISPSCLCHHCESLRSNCQERPNEHWCSLDKELDVTSLDKEIFNRKWLGISEHIETSSKKLGGATDCDDYVLSFEEQKPSIISEKTNMHVISRDLKEDSVLEPWNKAYSIDTVALKETGKYNCTPSAEIKEVQELPHTFFCSQPHRQTRSSWKHVGESSIQSSEDLSLDHSERYAARAMRDQSKQYFARAIYSHQDYHGSVPESIVYPLHKMISGASADSTSSSMSSQEHSQKGFYGRDGQSSYVNAGLVELEGRYSPQLSPSMSIIGWGAGRPARDIQGSGDGKPRRSQWFSSSQDCLTDSLIPNLHRNNNMACTSDNFLTF